MKPRPGFVKLERALSKLGFASRTQARVLIIAGKVKVNGVIRRKPDYEVCPERAKIEVEDQTITATVFRTFILHKPRGVVTTSSDEKGRPTVFSLLKSDVPHLIAIGRLDLATSGLLLLTNDTKLAAWLTDPVNAVPRTYLVSVRGCCDETKLKLLHQGIEDNGELLCAKSVTLRKTSGKESHLTVELTEGKNREIRRMFLTLGHEVTKLKRVAFGPLTLEKLQPGEYRELSKEELQRAFPKALLRG